MENIKQDISLKIKTDTVLLFDMDGTLIDTDFANFLSYEEAIQSIIKIGEKIPYVQNERFNRTSLKKLIPNLTEEKYEKIVLQKELNYRKHLSQTILNNSVADILTQYSKTNKTVLVTNCRKDRALLTLKYYNLSNNFSHFFFRQISGNGSKINKYENTIKHLKLSAQDVIVFENEETEINDAILAGVLIDNIITQ